MRALLPRHNFAVEEEKMDAIYCQQSSAVQIAAGIVTLLTGFATIVGSTIGLGKFRHETSRFPAMGIVLGLGFIAVGIVQIWLYPMWQTLPTADKFPILETLTASLLAMMYLCATLVMFNSRLLRYDILIGNLVTILFFPVMWRIDQLSDHENKAIGIVFYIYFLIQTVAYIIVYWRESQKFLDTMNGYFEQTGKQYNATETNLVFASWTLLSLWWATAKIIPILDTPKAFVIAQSAIAVVTTTVFVLYAKKSSKIAEVRNSLEQSQ